MQYKICCLLLAVIVVIIFSCSDCPERPECPAQHTITIYSGSGICDQDDVNISVVSTYVGTEGPAIISAGNTGCVCEQKMSGLDLPTLPVTSRNISDYWAKFYSTFELPSGFSDIKIKMYVKADDGAEISLNDNVVTHINLSDGVNTVWIFDSDLFTEGENTLRIEVHNRSSDSNWGPAQPKSGVSDCMYIEFHATITYWK